MDLEDHPDFPRFNMVSTGLRDAEDRLLQALKGGDKAEIVAAKVVLMGALDEYSKVADGIGKDPRQKSNSRSRRLAASVAANRAAIRLRVVCTRCGIVGGR